MEEEGEEEEEEAGIDDEGTENEIGVVFMGFWGIDCRLVGRRIIAPGKEDWLEDVVSKFLIPAASPSSEVLLPFLDGAGSAIFDEELQKVDNFGRRVKLDQQLFNARGSTGFKLRIG